MLEDLVSEIETLKSRIKKHREVLQGSEAQTRMSLIDPLLRVLGWETADPALVTAEYYLSGAWADYALLDADGKPVAIMEAKKLNEPLAAHVLQMVNYANLSGVPYAGLTDGNRWELYRVFDQKPLQDRLILNVSVASMPTFQCALQLLLLWQPNLASGQPIEASEPIVGAEPETPLIAMTSDTTVPTAPDAGWVTLTDIPTAPSASRTRPPVIRLPSGEERRITIWLDFLTEVAEWLIRDGALTPAKCPVPDKVYSDVYVVNIQPKHPRDIDFARHHQLSNSLFLYTHGTAKIYVDRSIALMEYFGKNPSTVHVQVG